MQDRLRVTLIQSHLHWENAVANRQHFTEILAGLKGETDLVVLPEMFTTGFSMNAKTLAEPKDGPTIHWMRAEAKKYKVAITGSVIIEDNGLYFNRLFFVFPDGNFQQYDKKHTFTLAKEHKTYTAGRTKLVVSYKGWSLCPLICYDLRFPVWARNTEAYDVLLFVANWPKVRIAAWDTLLKARAIENMSYCVGLNRVGLDGNGYEYNGHSAIYDVLGAQMTTTDFEKDFVQTVVLDKLHLQKQREQLQFLNDRDAFTLT